MKMIDWRVIAAIDAASPGGPDISRLAVVRLTGRPCVVAIVAPGPKQNQKARELADGPTPTCISR
jgi:hypothetical protein